MEGTNTLFVIRFEDIPKDRLNEICYTSLVFEIQPGKKDPNQTRITICGTNACYPGDVGTNTASLELFKFIINSLLSRAGAKYVCFDIECFCLSTPLGRLEYVKIQLSNILKNSSHNTSSTPWCKKGGYILKYVVGAMAYPNLECWQTNNSERF